jgi:peptidoglycan/LPS O-acetylase OafA/YrhL
VQPGQLRLVQGHSWSLAYEEQFYVIFPLIVAIGGARSRVFISMLFPLIVALCAIHLFLVDLGILGRTMTDYSFAIVFIAAGTFYAAHEALLRRLCATNAAPALGLLSIVIVFGPLLLPRLPAAGFLAPVWPVYFLCLVPFAAGWMITHAAYRDGILARILRTKALQLLGLISYSLYIWQQAFDAYPTLYLEDSMLTIAPLMFVFASASYFFIERPARALGKRFGSS